MIIAILMSSLLNAEPVSPAPLKVADTIYTLPAGEGLETPMAFTIEDAKLLNKGSFTKIEFKLPALLVGKESQTFTLRGRAEENRILLQGKGAKADCVVSSLKTDCQIAFENLILGHEAAEKFELESGASELSKELKAGREAFEHQAVGIITFIQK